MSVSFEIRSSIRGYRVTISPGITATLARNNSNAVFLVDEYFQRKFAEHGLRVIPTPADESAKGLERIPAIIERMRHLGVTRESSLVAVGGGVVQDIGSFCAAVYMRGIPWRYAPTTLLSMVDSCIGGKSSINVAKYKNLIGNFYPPEEILVDTDYLASLPDAARIAGLCESAKICFVRGDEAFTAYLGLGPGPTMDLDRLTRLIELSLVSKKWFIEADEFDRGERLLLNFGHTFGHAIESSSEFRISHGVAVGVGMLAAIHLSRSLYPDGPQATLTERLFNHVRTLLSAVPELQNVLRSLSISTLVDRFRADKKHGDAHFAIIAVNPVGRPERVKVAKSAEMLEQIAHAFEEAVASFSGETKEQGG